MSTKLQQSAPVGRQTPREDFRCVIIYAEWNAHITHTLRDGAVERLHESGVDDSRITLIGVPGTVELTYAAARSIERLHPSAVIAIGCVIRGDTPHFDYVCQSVTGGLTGLNAKGDVPVIFSVLTVENEQQALERAGGILGNKGSEGADAAIAMANLAANLI